MAGRRLQTNTSGLMTGISWFSVLCALQQLVAVILLIIGVITGNTNLLDASIAVAATGVASAMLAMREDR